MFECGLDRSDGAEEVQQFARGVPLFPMDSIFFNAIIATLQSNNICVLFKGGHSSDFCDLFNSNKLGKW